jgi:transcriptional regulator with XRE-family HTH domain
VSQPIESGFGRFIRQRRHELSMSQAALAGLWGVSALTVSNVEGSTRARLPSPEKAQALAHALRLPLIDLVRAAGYRV